MITKTFFLRIKLLFIVLIFALLSGCAGKPGVKAISIDNRFKDMNRSALTSSNLSERTLMFLRQHDLDETWENDSVTVLNNLSQRFEKVPNQDTLFALVELCFYKAKSAEGSSDDVLKYYLSSAYYSYNYLFDDTIGQMPSPYHPHSRLVCEFYNRSLAGCLLYVRENNVRNKEGIRTQMLNGGLSVKIGKIELEWRAEELNKFYVAYEFEPVGLENNVKTYGLGVPLIAVRTPEKLKNRKKEERFTSKIQQTYAATALLRFKKEKIKQNNGKFLYQAVFDVYDPLKTDEVTIREKTTPLETDFTTPLAFFIENTKQPGGLEGLFKVNSWKELQGLHMLQPYEPEKIPIVFVHGLMSSPETWLRMLNNMLADTKIREKFQFWFFMYPTGNPIPYSASILRSALEDAHKTFDPEGINPAFNQMVLIGHSMGGLLSKLMILKSGDEVWEKISDVPFSELSIATEQRDFLKSLFFFDPLPYISRMIFISTPHRGSVWADRRIGRIGASLVKLPLTLLTDSMDALSAMVQTNQNKYKINLDRMPTGIDSLSPDSFFLKLSNELPLPDHLPYHSIIGNNEKADTIGGTDGVVVYESAHLEGAVSEKIVKSGHSAHNHPLAILEVRRILLEHLNEVEKSNRLGSF